ncbi:MAG TPA: hypothetical protein VF894_14600 [Anaeromyxobacter sp.]
MTAGPQEANVHDRRWRRAIVTGAALAAAWVLGQLRIPGWDAAVVYDPGALALGLAPIISGFVLVELAALAVPAWDALRHAGPAARAKLAVAAHAVAAALAVVQAYGVARYATDVGALPDAAAPRAAAIATLAVGPFLLAALARWVDGRGLTNGLALIVAGTAGVELVGGFSGALSVPEAPDATALLIPAVGVGVAVSLFGRALRRPVPPPGAAAPAIPMPACGIAPLAVPAAALLLPATLAVWFPGLARVGDVLRPGANVYHAAEAVLALALVPLLGILFNRSGAVARAWDALPAVPAGADLVAFARLARRRAIVRSALLVGAALAIAHVVRVNATVPFIGQRAVVAAIVVLAVALDVAREWRARRAGAFGAIWPLHRALEAEPVVARLAAAGIPAFVRGPAFRALYQFFAPYAPVVVFVPPEQAEAASAILRRAFAAEPARAAGRGDQMGGRARSP